MKTTVTHIIAAFVIATCFLLLASTRAHAQKDPVEFKFIPKYYPEDEVIPMPPPEIAYSPKLVFPSDPQLQGKQADVWVKVLIDRKGGVIDARILKSSDEAFNKYAIKYAKQYSYKWNQKWPDELKDAKGVWSSIPARFRP
jgi:TonB family protein